MSCVNAGSRPCAWAAADALADDPRVGFLPEPEGVTLLLRSWTRTRTVGAASWTGAYLAAFALQAGLKLATLDKGALLYPIETERIE